MATRPLIVLPGGFYITERGVKRFHVSPRAKAWLQGLAVFAGFLLLIALSSFDGVSW